VILSWNASAGATYYHLKRSTTSGGPYTILPHAGETTGYTDSELTNGATYYYVVSAFNAGGESPDSSPVSAGPR
jgi:fibronectin type 3 domain-containing protein